MRFIADLHLHSHFSVATSKELVPEQLDRWARIKGVTVVGTGDFTHPGWLAELRDKLDPAEEGLFALKPALRVDGDPAPPGAALAPVRFLLTAEISNVYKRGDRVRKVHNLVLAPDFASVERICARLEALGANLTSDGRPILGLDSRDLLELVLEAAPEALFVPAHVWTPWFSALGSKSGFDSIDECFRDLSQHIHAVETGLSADAPMLWACRFLDGYTLLSNSDAHSPERMARNANVLDTGLSYPDIISALRTGDPERFLGTIDLFPQEGKYHYDGHRKCGVRWNPQQTLRRGGICPVCGKPVTLGVLYRVAQLADRADLDERPNRHPFRSIIPLKELLAEITGKGRATRTVARAYARAVAAGGPECALLLDRPPEAAGDLMLAEAIRRMRARTVRIEEGYDGEYGVVRAFAEGEVASLRHARENALFAAPTATPSDLPARPVLALDLTACQGLREHAARVRAGAGSPSAPSGARDRDGGDLLAGLNPQQRQAATHATGPALVLAGPGTGKTHTLACRVAHLMGEQGVRPDEIVAVTFTNKAAEEMRARLRRLLGVSGGAVPRVLTFHSLGLAILAEATDRTGRTARPLLFTEDDRRRVLAQSLGLSARAAARASRQLREHKQAVACGKANAPPELADLASRYEAALRAEDAFDLDDLVPGAVRALEADDGLWARWRAAARYLLVDEYQDIDAAQYCLVRALAPERDANLCAIGDPNQAIYGFRGADVRYVQRFVEDYPEAAVYRLRQSYRCSARILRASHDVMDRADGDPLDGLQQGVQVRIVRHRTDRSEAEFVARTIEALAGGLRFFSMDSGVTSGAGEAEITSLADFAVLCRTARQFPLLEKAFADHSIPWQTVGSTPLFEAEPARTVLDALRLAQRPDSRYLRARLETSPMARDVGADALGGLARAASWPENVKGLLDSCAAAGHACAEPVRARLMLLASQAADLSAFLARAALGASVDAYDPRAEAVTLMTLHAAKGLEFPCVFVTGCEEGLMPYRLFKRDAADPEEERRVLYVGMTRAARFLYLTHAARRRLFGRDYRPGRSPFLDRIEEALQEEGATGARARRLAATRNQRRLL